MMIPGNKDLKKKKLFLLDIDGTVAFDATFIDGAMEFFHHVESIDGKYIFITNNSTKSIKDYVSKFHKMGLLHVDESNFLTSSYAMGLYLKEVYPKDKIFVLGTNSFVEELKGFGLTVTTEVEEDIKACVVGFDNELTYTKIHNICELLETKDVDYLATNPDLVCPVGFGFVPDCGAICQMIGTAAKREPLYIGKPNRRIVDIAIGGTSFTPEETIVVGDRLYTDIACGIAADVDTAVVFTGEAKFEDLEATEFKPTYYCENIRKFYECLI